MKSTSRNSTNSFGSFLSRLLAAIWLLIAMGCSVVVTDYKAPQTSDSLPVTDLPTPILTPAQDHAGEILAYFLQIAVGHIGTEQSRQAWRSAGNKASLDFQTISTIMREPAMSKSDLMVLDYDLVALVEVLSHYNPHFNLFKGKYVFDSVYPSSELVAIRLLIQRKLNRGEKVSFTALQEREALLRSRAIAPSQADLTAMNLSAAEFQLVKDAFTADPLFLQYYKHPFIVDTLTRVGFYQPDRFTATIGRNASYSQYAPRSRPGDRQKMVNIGLLPSFNREFEFGARYEKPYVFGFKPSAKYMKAIEKLTSVIANRTASILLDELKSSGKMKAVDDLSWKRLWNQSYAPRIDFQVYDQRPLTIYPENADRLIKDIYPKADLIILLLGEGMDRAMGAKATSDKFSTTGWLYFSMDDISYFRRNDKIDEIARSIADRLLTIRISAAAPNTGG